MNNDDERNGAQQCAPKRASRIVRTRACVCLNVVINTRFLEPFHFFLLLVNQKAIEASFNLQA